MSWLARSIADSLGIDDGVDQSGDEQDQPLDVEDVVGKSDLDSAATEAQSVEFKQEDEDFDDSSRGVKEDLTELKQTLTRQFWGVASFLAPPPSPPPPPPPPLRLGTKERDSDADGEGEVFSDEDDEVLHLDQGMNLRNVNEFREGTEISHIEAAALPILDRDAAPSAAEEEEEVWDVVGITEEVLTFGRNIAMHPETWLDYPIEEEDDPDEFVMTTDQQEHTYAMEYLSPRLAALRIELCPAHMSEGYFWKVYFVLLHSRLEKQDAEILSTPQVMTARSLWMRELQKQTRERASLTRDTSHFNEHFHPAEDHHLRTSNNDSYSGTLSYRTYDHATADHIVEKHPIPSTETHIVDKTVIVDKSMIEITDKIPQSSPSLKQLIEDEEDDEDDWLKDENINTSIPIWEEEEVSFSDLDDDEDLLPLKPKHASTNMDTSTPEL